MIEHEHGWYDHPNDGFGIGQFNSFTWATYKPCDPAEQVRAGLRYIKDRYGDVKGETDKSGETL